VTAKTSATSGHEHFDPAHHERELVAILHEIEAASVRDFRTLDRILKRHPKDGRGLFSRSELIAGHRRFGVGGDELLDVLQLRPVRTRSGVTPVTVLTKPFPCPGRCVFCPNDVRMPKSYLSSEPGCQRAEANGFDPYLQTWNRLDALHRVGHPVEKVELIVLGGTWSAYPDRYQVWFVKRCLEALCDFGRGDKQGIGAALAPDESATWEELARVQRENEAAGCRCVGLAVETRPDCVSEEEVRRIRRLGATKVQIGIQSLSDDVLARNQRGHDVATTRRALRLLRGAALKIHAHWMPNLLGASPEADVSDFKALFDDPDFRPDELKLYPCSLIESAELMRFYEAGEWRPYGEDELLDVVTECLAYTPSWCRVTRVIRDFSSGDIVDGNRVANLREVAERRLRLQGRPCRDIRAREIGGRDCADDALSLDAIAYATSLGEEVFLQFVTADDRIAGFLRLGLPREDAWLEQLRGSALLREVHVYGPSLPVGRRAAGRPQHQGLGRSLVEEATRRAGAAGFTQLSVVSAVGTRAYYRDLGFADGALYQHLPVQRAGGSSSGAGSGPRRGLWLGVD
jgi:elongator complex protein 3